MIQLLILAYIIVTLYVAIRYFSKQKYAQGCGTIAVSAIIPPVVVIGGLVYLWHDANKPTPSVRQIANSPKPHSSSSPPVKVVQNRAYFTKDGRMPKVTEDTTMMLPGYIGAVVAGGEPNRSCFASIDDLDGLEDAVATNDTGRMMHYIYDATLLTPGQHILGLETVGLSRMRVRLLDGGWVGTECYIERDLVKVRHLHRPGA